MIIFIVILSKRGIYYVDIYKITKDLNLEGVIRNSKMPSYTLELLPENPNAAKFYKNSVRSNDNAGVDLFVPTDVTFQPGEKKLVSMGVKARMITNNQHYAYVNDEDRDPSVHYWMPSRSSISKTGLLLLNSIGVIDKSYRGELMAFLWNTTDKVVEVKEGDRLVQIVAPDMGHINSIHLVNSLDETARGSGGFGSTQTPRRSEWSRRILKRIAAHPVFAATLSGLRGRIACVFCSGASCTFTAVQRAPVFES